MWYSEFYNGLLDHKYVSLGIQYYLLARVGTKFPFNPASGNLFHLGFELLIKSYLRSQYSSKQLKSKFNHKLVELWDEFKAEVSDDNLNKFDLIVKSLDFWEKVRYIDLKDGKNAQSIVISPGKAPKEYLEEINNTDFQSIKSFTIYTDDMDELFMAFFSALKVPPEELLKNPDFAMGRHLYEQDNKHNFLDKDQRDIF
jgi:hypothetical protein